MEAVQQPTVTGGIMRAWVAYVTYEHSLGSQILGVRAKLEEGKSLAAVHLQYMLEEVDEIGAKLNLTWGPYDSHEGKGEQAILPHGTYYVEEVELELIPPNDERSASISWEQVQVLRLTVENGRMASALLERDKMIEPLQVREKELESMIDYLIKRWVKDPNDPDIEHVTHYTFPNGEVWKVGENKHGTSG